MATTPVLALVGCGSPTRRSLSTTASDRWSSSCSCSGTRSRSRGTRRPRSRSASRRSTGPQRPRPLRWLRRHIHDPETSGQQVSVIEHCQGQRSSKEQIYLLLPCLP